MAIEIKLTLPENIIENAKQFGAVTQQEVESVLTDALELLWPTFNDLPAKQDYPPIDTLSDEVVNSLADAKMDKTQNERLGFLQEKGKTATLTIGERYELMALLQIYQLGQLRKSEALAEAVKRGLRKKLPQ